ncbi:ATP-binding protein [Salinicoccus jeotgali]|uniref:ATP-binding protein n=1 Tax=Salinicoccus jeotgali TaxID=381634 RepID=A0ABP7EQX1_9STAP
MEELSKLYRDVESKVAVPTRKPVERTFSHRCDGCNRRVQLVTFDDGNKKEIGCHCDKVQSDRKKIEIRKQKEYWRASMFPYSHKRASFDKFKTFDNKKMERALIIAKRYADKFAENFKQKRLYERYERSDLTLEEFNQEYGTAVEEDAEDILTNLIMKGAPGTGKTMLANAIYHQLHKEGFKCFFISSSEYLERVKDGFDDSAAKVQLRKYREEADLFVLDDIGTSFDKPWKVDEFYKLMEIRKGKFNVFTTNLSDEEFVRTIELERIHSRMNQDAYTIRMDFEDYRLKGDNR